MVVTFTNLVQSESQKTLAADSFLSFFKRMPLVNSRATKAETEAGAAKIVTIREFAMGTEVQPKVGLVAGQL